MEPIVIDAKGKPCPLPVIEAKRALRNLPPTGGIITVLVDDEIAHQNLEKMGENMGHQVSFRTLTDGTIAVDIAATGKTESPPISSGAGLVVAFGHNQMGGGDEALGNMLMKAFVFSLTELDIPPEHLLFFNSGSFLTQKNSDAQKDLVTLLEKGTLISTCGTCLNFYGIADTLAIGDITNMYGIACLMAEAGRVINL